MIGSPYKKEIPSLIAKIGVLLNEEANNWDNICDDMSKFEKILITFRAIHLLIRQSPSCTFTLVLRKTLLVVLMQCLTLHFDLHIHQKNH